MLKRSNMAIMVTWLAILTVALSAISPTGTARAQIELPPDASAPAIQETVALSLNCSTVPNTELANEMMKKYNLCGRGSQQAGDIGIDNAVVGNCGTLSLYVFDSRGGYMQWNGTITSSVGPFVYASYNGDWLNTTTNGGGLVSRNTGLTFATNWPDIHPIYTRPGLVDAQITSAFMQLSWGGQCTSNGTPYDYTWVT